MNKSIETIAKIGIEKSIILKMLSGINGNGFNCRYGHHDAFKVKMSAGLYEEENI
ncbi:MAG: hypothetical protein QXY47_07670 [Thermoplasmata archaeon]